MKDLSKFFSKKMCQYAGVDFNSVDFDDIDNSQIYWTREDRRRFIAWMADYLKTHKAVRMQAMQEPDKSKIKSFVRAFVVAYGFKIKKSQ